MNECRGFRRLISKNRSRSIYCSITNRPHAASGPQSVILSSETNITRFITPRSQSSVVAAGTLLIDRKELRHVLNASTRWTDVLMSSNCTGWEPLVHTRCSLHTFTSRLGRCTLRVCARCSSVCSRFHTWSWLLMFSRFRSLGRAMVT